VKQNNRNIGNKGESAAAELLVSAGYEILARNFRNKWGEIDIVASCKLKVHQVWEERVVFVEVKTKTGEEFGEPWEMINKHKLKAVENMGHLWCQEFGWKGLCRIDVVGVWLDEAGEVVRVEHWEDVQI
jgi:putative endonuclease